MRDDDEEPTPRIVNASEQEIRERFNEITKGLLL